MSEVWKKLNKIRGKFSSHPPPLLKKPNGDLTGEPEDTAEMLADGFSKVSSEENYTAEFITYKKAEEKKQICHREGCNTSEPYNDPFTLNELKSALVSTSETNPGMDQIT